MKDRTASSAGIARIALAGAIASLAACAAARAPVDAAPETPLPLAEQSAQLGLRVESRELTGHSINLVVELMVRAPIAGVSVAVGAEDPGLDVVPRRCHFRVLAPPIVAHAMHPPYPLPAIPLCSLVLSAVAGGRYPVTLRVRDGAGRDLVAPIHTVIIIKGS